MLQNLVLLVDGGQVSASAVHEDNQIWGATLGSKTIVARSGVGVTADGALVYVAGPALSARTLAESLQRAGAVRGMALDLNPEWVTLNFFEHSRSRRGLRDGSCTRPSNDRRPATSAPPPNPATSSRSSAP